MPDTITRVELRGSHIGADVYERLHEAMKNRGSFYRVVQGDSGKWSSLPHATYSRTVDRLTVEEVDALAYQIASSIWKDAGTITASPGWASHGLSVV